MSTKTKIIILLIAIGLAAAAVSIVYADTNSILEFFGFGKPTATPTPTPSAETSGPYPKDQDSDDWFDEIDPPLVEPDEPDKSSKSSSSWFEDEWESDPFADSFSGSHFDEMPSGGFGSESQKMPDPPVQPAPVRPAPPRPAPSRSNQNPYPVVDFYRIQDNPVFRPMYMLPSTGISGTGTAPVRESVKYAKTNMSLSIPRLNVNENIVIVPLVDGNYPVESLGSNIGLLEGSGPGEDDLFVLAAHNHLDEEEKGPFDELSAMKVSDLIFVRGAKNASRTFVVYANELFAADDIDGLLSYAKPGCMILITCEDESVDGGYLNRRVIFAEAKVS